ncbi:hypothetical protein JTE90_016422 [Oedothorax gibbosus]|uniref:Uncharacterized protein n=1 Tax=Oedothorax gibbosus TaxID=931172 RepID=A0AAV6TCR6_9ARAC|nr:hypothetical protein JTE90_016422 [Oedothorax gibbosus]
MGLATTLGNSPVKGMAAESSQARSLRNANSPRPCERGIGAGFSPPVSPRPFTRESCGFFSSLIYMRKFSGLSRLI